MKWSCHSSPRFSRETHIKRRAQGCFSRTCLSQDTLFCTRERTWRYSKALEHNGRRTIRTSTLPLPQTSMAEQPKRKNSGCLHRRRPGKTTNHPSYFFLPGGPYLTQPYSSPSPSSPSSTPQPSPSPPSTPPNTTSTLSTGSPASSPPWA